MSMKSYRHYRNRHLQSVKLFTWLAYVGIFVLGIVFLFLGYKVHYKARVKIDHLARARAAFAANDFKLSEKEFVSALAESGVPGTVWRELGLAYQEDHKRDEAIKAYEKSLSFQANDPFTLNVLGNLYRDKGNYVRAETTYKQALNNGNKLVPVIVNLSQIYVLEGSKDKAIDSVLTYYKGSKEQAELGLRLAYLYHLNGQNDLAKSVIEQLLKVDPTNNRAKNIQQSL
jgi:Flp pilus assembly protein TadD